MRQVQPIGRDRWLETHFVGPLVLCLSLLLLVFGVTTGIFSITKKLHNDASRDHRRIMSYFISEGEDARDLSPETRDQRRYLAKQILEVMERQDQIGKRQPLGFYTDHQVESIRKTAETGEPVKLYTGRWSFSWYWSFFSPLAIFCIFSVFGVFFLIHFYFNVGPSYRLADLPWRQKAWPWMVTFLGGPFVWVTMAGSTVLLRREPPLAIVEPTNEQLPGVLHLGENEEEEEEEEDDEPPPPRRPPRRNYISALRVARDLYVRIRTEEAEAWRRRRLSALDGEIEDEREAVRSHGRLVREGQQAVNDLRAEKERLAESLRQGVSSIQPETLGEEFDRLVTLPGVIAVQVVDEQIRLIVRASISYEERTYDLGDWRMDFGPDTTHIHARELRSGVRQSWNGSYPAYRLGDEVFCFGGREYEIDEHLRQGQYLEAMALATECLNSVNPNDQYLIPEAFKEVEAR